MFLISMLAKVKALGMTHCVDFDSGSIRVLVSFETSPGSDMYSNTEYVFTENDDELFRQFIADPEKYCRDWNDIDTRYYP